jgi:hypothetical protein
MLPYQNWRIVLRAGDFMAYACFKSKNIWFENCIIFGHTFQNLLYFREVKEKTAIAYSKSYID